MNTETKEERQERHWLELRKATDGQFVVQYVAGGFVGKTTAHHPQVITDPMPTYADAIEALNVTVALFAEADAFAARVVAKAMGAT